jgi:hypothetical protein
MMLSVAFSPHEGAEWGRVKMDKSGLAEQEADISDDKFANDLLVEERDRRLAETRWPTVFYVLDHPMLLDTFVPHDDRANRAKRRGRKAGFLSIGPGCLALFTASQRSTFLKGRYVYTRSGSSDMSPRVPPLRSLGFRTPDSRHKEAGSA